ncbi:MAG: hypothetical protein AB1511_07685 [Deinococcota bacterium]
MFIATYGHGKSHFGLAAANYFGQPQGSPELETVLAKLDHVLPADQAAMFRQYREHTAPFLVLILQGDRPGSLRDHFFRALDEALAQHAATQQVRPPFWFEAAERALGRIADNSGYAELAEQFLARHDLDLFSLRDMVQKREAAAYTLSVEVFRTVYGVAPDFGAETALNEAVGWVADTFCGPDKPFGGLLILFDEFSLFVRDYQMNNRLGAPFQDLMNGVSNRRGKVLFVGLSQHDPNVIAERSGSAGADLLKELNRIPQPNRQRMQTMLEDVLGAYFRTNEHAWGEFMAQRGVAAHVANASELAYTLYRKRYGPGQMGWNLETFQEKVAKQCFPLHPLTTALLSSVDLEKSTSVRSVLNFVLDEEGGVRTHFDQPAQLPDGRPNWVLPTLLVDYFGEMLDEDKYKNFRNVFKPDLDEGQKAVLKAMLLLDTAGLSTREVGYEVAIAELAGLSEADATRILKGLEAEQYIRRDNANKTYAFYVGSNSAMELDRRLKENIFQREQKGTLHMLFSTYTAQGNPANDLGLTACHEVTTEWGNPTDWAAQEVLLPFSALKPTVLDALSAQYAVPLDKGPKARGVVVLVVPTTQAEADAAPAKVRELFSVSPRYETAPMLFVCPREPLADLTHTLHKLAVLHDPVFKSGHELKVGSSIYEEMIGRLREQAATMLEHIRKGGDLVVPPAISGGLAAKNITPTTAKRLQAALEVIYAAAYSKHPDRFFTQYKLSATTLNKAVVNVIHSLWENALDTMKWPPNASIEKDLVRMLQESWGIVSPRKQVVAPQHSRIKEAWARLDATFSPQAGKVLAAEVLQELLQPPYGYDQNTLALLFAAWIGKNRNAIKLGGVGRLRSPGNNQEKATAGFKKPADFLKTLAAVEISRKDMGQELAKVKAVLDALETGPLSQVEAKRHCLILEDFKTNNPGYDTDYLEQLDRAAGKLRQGLENLDTYDQAVTDFEVKLSRANRVEAAVPLMDTLTKLPPLTVVASQKPGVEELRTKLTGRILQMTEQQAAELSKLSDLGQFALREQQLKGMQAALRPLNLTQARERIDQALRDLQTAKARLEAQQAAEQEVSLVKAIPTQGNLATLRASLQNLTRLDLKSDQAAKLADEKYTQIKEATQQLEAHLKDLPHLLDGVSDVKAARKLHQQLLQEHYQYQGTAEAKQVEAAGSRAEQLVEYFEALTNWRSPTTPQEAEETRIRLTQLGEQYAALLSAGQQAQAKEALARLDAQVAERVVQAQAWLQERRARLESGADTELLARELETPPTFLPEASRPALDTLRSVLRSQLDAAAQEKAALGQIGAVPETGPIVKLRERLAELQTWPILTPALTERIRIKQERLRAELTRLETLPGEWEAQAVNLLSSQAADKLHADIVRQETCYQGSEWEGRVQALSTRVKQLEEILREVEVLRGRRDTRLRELTERRQCLEALLPHAALSQGQRERIRQDVQEVQRQYDEQLGRLTADINRAAKVLGSATTVRAVQAVDLGHFPRPDLPVEWQTRLQELEDRQRALAPVLQELERLSEVPLRDLAQASGVLHRLEELAVHPTLSAAQQVLAEDLRQKLLGALEEKRRAAEAWLRLQRAHFDALQPEDGPGLAQVEQALRMPPAFLDAQALQELQALHSDLQHRLEESEVLQIEVLFSRITSLERRQACLERLRQLIGLTPA